MVAKQSLGKWKNLVGPDGTPWIDGSDMEQLKNESD
jgi:hypothetical protein